jgi:transposase
MPKILRARAAQNEQEEHQVRKLAVSRHGPADWITHARMVMRSWDGQRVEAIAKELQCSALTVRRRLHRFNREGIEGLGDRPRSGRPRRLTETERSKLIALVRKAPPGRWETQADETLVARDEEGSAQWSLNALARAAKEAGIQVKRSQIRTIFLREGVRWRRTHSWGTSSDEDFARNPNHGRLPLHAAARRLDDHLHRRTGTGDPTRLPARSWLVPHGASPPSTPGLQSRTRENLDLWSAPGA